MSTAEANELSDVLDRVKSWSPPLRIALTRRILETLDLTPADLLARIAKGADA
jgi:hypothetical protein